MIDMEPNVYIVDDDAELCASLKWLLESVNLKIKIYNDGRAYLEAYRPEHRGCLLLDIRMPTMSGLQVQEKLNELGNQMPVIIISGHADVPLAIRAMKGGAFDLITKPFNEQQLLEQIYAALEQDKQRQIAPERAALEKRFEILTQREKEVMEYIIKGKLNKQIAAELGISIKTVELHRSNLMHKLQIKNIAELMKLHFILNKDKVQSGL